MIKALLLAPPRSLQQEDNSLTRIRIITALVALPIIIVIVQLGGWVFSLVLTLLALIAAWEYVQMMAAKGHKLVIWFAWTFVLVTLANAQFPERQLFVPAFTLLLILLLVWQLFQADSTAQPVDWALTVAGSLFIGFGLGHLLGLRLQAAGHVWVWLVLLCAWGADTAAYFGGRAFGKHKFWPRWSPKKTWEGIVAGILGGIIGGGLVSLIFSFPFGHAVMIGVLVALVGPFGDLSISMMKRYAGVKDSSNLVPGHGGFLDRMDSILFASVAVFYYAFWVVR
jgi:phosphatidate cytidylyltransferase